jgi:hypothetical protein
MLRLIVRRGETTPSMVVAHAARDSFIASSGS